MRIRRRVIPLIMSLGFVVTGCGALPDFLLPTAAGAAKQAVQATVEEAVQNTIGGLLGSVLPIPNPPTTSQPAP